MRRSLILIHRYLGIALSVLFTAWFLSGIAMMYAKGMPGVTSRGRLEWLAPILPEQVRLTAAEAIEKAGSERPPGRVLLTTLAGRPVFRIGDTTVFADNGEVMKEIDAEGALDIAVSSMNVTRDRLRQTLQTEVDQWTISQRGQLPLHKITVDDAAHTELYVSMRSGEIVMMTTAANRALAWIAAIPHWMYFTSLRTRDALWRQIILWTSGLGSVLALIGVILGFTQFKVRYTGWMRWHYRTGVVFGVFTLTWIFSGWLSMDPWNWSIGGGLGDEIPGALSGGPLAARGFPDLNVAELSRLAADAPIKEVEYARIQGDPYYIVRTSMTRLLVSAGTMQLKTEPFSVESLLNPVAATYPAVQVVESGLLTQYDSYYYARDGALPLPVLRIKLGDEDRTWFYIEPEMSRLVLGIHRRGRVNRWIYHGFHSLDFAFWYYRRPEWDIGMIALSLGGTATSIIGVYLGIRRLRRGRPGRAIVRNAHVC